MNFQFISDRILSYLAHISGVFFCAVISYRTSSSTWINPDIRAPTVTAISVIPIFYRASDWHLNIFEYPTVLRLSLGYNSSTLPCSYCHLGTIPDHSIYSFSAEILPCSDCHLKIPQFHHVFRVQPLCNTWVFL